MNQMKEQKNVKAHEKKITLYNSKKKLYKMEWHIFLYIILK